MPNNSLKERIIDAGGQSLGRVCSQAAFLLQGKHLPSYRRNKPANLKVRLINSKDIKFTGSKLDLMKLHKSSGYPGGLKSVTLRYAFNKSPELLIKRVVENMLPSNRLRKSMLKSLSVE